MSFKRVIFDCDGVLVDSEVITNKILVENLAGYGLQIGLAECMHLFVGGTMKGVFGEVRKRGAKVPDDWVDEIYAEIYAGLKQGTSPVTGVIDVLDRLDDADIGYCVASNGSMEKMQITLGQNGLWDRFEGAIFSAHELGVAKPDPGLFLIAAGDIAAQDCAVIEDSLSGVRAARAAGMRCFGYHENGDGLALAAENANLFDDMQKLPALLGLGN